LQSQSLAENMLVDKDTRRSRELPRGIRLLLSRRHCELLSDSHSNRRRVFVYSARYIRAGEELTYDYQFPLDERKVTCRCGSTACRGTINMASGELELDEYDVCGSSAETVSTPHTSTNVAASSASFSNSVGDSSSNSTFVTSPHY
jgi:hypothetical protein